MVLLMLSRVLQLGTNARMQTLLLSCQVALVKAAQTRWAIRGLAACCQQDAAGILRVVAGPATMHGMCGISFAVLLSSAMMCSGWL
jgi:hypothetical protein